MGIRDGASFHKRFGPKTPSSRQISKKAKALVPAFHQAITSAGMQFSLVESARGGQTQVPPPRDSTPQTVAVQDEISSQSIHHLVDEPFNEEETSSRKRRRVETEKAIADVEPKKFIALEAESALTPDVEAISTVGAVMERRPSGVEGVRDSRVLTRTAEGGSSSATGVSRVVPAGDDDSGLDVDPKEVQAFLENNTRVEIRMEDPNRHIMILVDYDLLSNSEWAVPAVAPLCTASENKALQAMNDADLSLVYSAWLYE
uniref:Uncharacterized protein LOC104236512 n=1 Tax=Nicotiana sylvestris TaxID=4096 RepID=A0A1U7XP66_NICSY|nr:PREDICTED: uncharacterized protein LOC104236512 [Nicotiana sylvestris]